MLTKKAHLIRCSQKTENLSCANKSQIHERCFGISLLQNIAR